LSQRPAAEILTSPVTSVSEAKEQIAHNRILGFEELNRLGLYERQINAVLKSLINQLERH